MVRGLLITGTDTNVGKTTVAAAVMLRYRNLHRLKYWKPIQTGIEIDDDTRTVRELTRCADNELHPSGIRLRNPLAPYLSAKLSGTRITIEKVVAHIGTDPESVRWIVEGAGGVLVPINESETMIDLMTALGIPVVIAARSSLGTINHTLMTLEALRHRKLETAGVVMVGERNAANREAIETFGKVAVIDEIPHFDALTSETLGQWTASGFDSNAQLERYFR